MIDGIVDILLQVEDMNNRREMAQNVIADFEEEGIVYDKEAFLTRVGLAGTPMNDRSNGGRV